MILSGVTPAAGEIQTRGGTGEDPYPAIQSLSSWHDASLHLLGLRIFLDRRPTGCAACQTPHRMEETAACVQKDQGTVSGESASAGSSLLHRTQWSAAGSLSLLWGPWELSCTLSLL